MLDISICKELTGEISCLVFNVDPNITLDILRKRIENEARELMPKEFRFMMFSVVIVSLGHEHTVLVSKAIMKRNGEEYVIEYQKCPENEAEQHSIPVDIQDNDLSDEGKDETEIEKMKDQQLYRDKCESKSIDKTDVQTCLNISAFSKQKSPTNCQLKGIKLYSEKEIECSSDKEKERRKFWNQRAKQLSKESMKKDDLYQQIHHDWRMHKDDTIKQKGQTSGTSSTVKNITFKKNVARVENAKQMLTDLKKEMEECVKSDADEKKKMSRLEEKFSSAKSELRKAQDASRKTTAKLK